jgi:hypothetical protein
MEKRKIISGIVGILQFTIGITFLILTILLFTGFVEIQMMFNNSNELFPVYLLVLGSFSFFSIISGIFLVGEFRK